MLGCVLLRTTLDADCGVPVAGVSVQVFSLSAFPLHSLETFLFQLGEASLRWVVFDDLLTPFVLPSVEVVVLLDNKIANKLKPYAIS